MTIKKIKEITAKEENFRTEQNEFGFHNIRRDSIEPVPIGTHIVMVFKVIGYDKDCDGSLMARLAHVDKNGEPTGWAPTHLGLYPDTDWIVDSPDEIDKLAK